MLTKLTGYGATRIIRNFATVNIDLRSRQYQIHRAWNVTFTQLPMTAAFHMSVSLATRTTMGKVTCRNDILSFCMRKQKSEYPPVCQLAQLHTLPASWRRLKQSGHLIQSTASWITIIPDTAHGVVRNKGKEVSLQPTPAQK